MNKESKRNKFIRIAEARTNKIISMIQLLGNCANPASYEYTEKDVSDIFNTIEKEVRIAKSKLCYAVIKHCILERMILYE